MISKFCSDDFVVRVLTAVAFLVALGLVLKAVLH